MSAKILYNRYYHLLKPLRSVKEVSDALFSRKMLSEAEKVNILSQAGLSHGKHALCQVLSERKAADYVIIATIFTNEQKRQSLEDGPSSEVLSNGDTRTSVTTTTTSSSATTSTGTSVCTSSEGSQDFDEIQGTEEVVGGSGERFSTAGSSTPTGNGNGEGSIYSKALKGNKEVSDESILRSYHQSSYAYAQPGGTTNTKHLTTDVPDPPTEILTPSGSCRANPDTPPTKMEDAFIILLFTFLTQQLQLLWGRRPHDLADPQRTQSYPQHKEKEPATSTSSSTTQWSHGQAMFPWLEVDVQVEECRDYFPSEIIKSVLPNPSNPTPLRLSVILEAFQQFLRRFEDVKRESQSLQRKGRMYDELFKKCRILEEKLTQSRLEQQQQGRNGLSHATDPIAREKISRLEEMKTTLEGKIADLEEQLRQVDPLQRAYIRSEERCKQLVEVTQQWSIECEEKLRVIKMLEKEAEQLKAQIQHLEGRVAKYKKYWADTKDQQLGRVSDAQFEELRSELSSRRQLYDQVLAQRDEAAKKVKLLLLENESLKDHNVQLMDRADNFKVQAQAKEPSVREMSNLLQQKGRLESELEAMKKENAELSDKVMGLEILVQDLTAKQDHLQGLHRPSTKRSQAMVIGYGTPLRTQTPLGANTHASQLLVAPSNGPAHLRQRSESAYSRDEDERLSLTSSEASESGKFSSFGSTSGQSSRRSPSVQPSRSGFGSHDLPLRSRDPSLDEPPPAEAPLVRDPPQGNECDDSEDYTHRIRYPNNSRILVPPLLDEDISLRGGAGGSTSTSVGVPKFRDQGGSGSVEGALKSRNEVQQRGKNPKGGGKDSFYCDRSHFDYQVPRYPDQQSNGVEVAFPPNQPTAVLPPSSSFLQPPSMEKKCPVCQHSFFTLSEREFQSHVATCYR